ncbi:HNH endonuclease [Paracandidimonas lactea]|uniref:HNH endonuclease n=1 Tax=Paracandidimonas lactea TaxID=2895524 RepID=UPI001F30F9F1|nr:HNH endonuclease [Paracandidimonas lactea]
MTRKPWTEIEVKILRKFYADSPTERIAQALGRPLTQVYAKARRLGLVKSPAYLDSPHACRLRHGDNLGAEYRFKPGLIPANKGIRRPGYAPGRMAHTQFKVGQNPHNTLPIGAYRLDPSGILQRKISNNKGSNSMRWRGVHELVWVEANGPVPPKHIVVFKPGMRTNILEQITLDRVECISLAENMRRNSLHRYPKEIGDAIRARAVLNRRINHVEKHQ